MEFTLINYQERAARDVLKHVARATQDFDDDGDRTAVILTAPTGSGKTVIASAVLETLFVGGDLGDPQDGLTVLWVTDDPNLNEQTRRKISMASDVNLQMEVIKTTGNFDQETLDRGKLYFINIQALAKTTSLVKPGNGRNWSIWETLDNTVRERGRDFIVVVDEAHRGAQPDKSTASIVQTIVGGDHPVPIVVGISATATKFLATVEAGQTSSRTIRPVHVKMVDVQASGLVKDRIVLYSPDDDEHEVNADTTLIRHAVRRTREYEARWTEYTERQDGEAVSPALVIQLEDSPTEAHLREVYDAVIGEWPELNTSNFVNTFSDHKAESLGGGLFIQYMRPHLIQDLANIRVILAKNAITTGWDCPRAEVLVSLRTAKDSTYIAQLIGRIVRQPLARRIEDEGLLNQVYAVLPNFDDSEVDKVAALFDSSAETGTGSQVVRATVESRPTPGAEEAAKLLTELPTYTIPGQIKVPQVKRLHALSAELAQDGLVPDARAQADLVLHTELDQIAKVLGKKLENRKARVAQVHIKSSIYDTTGKLLGKEDHGADNIDANNISDLFKVADRNLRDGLGTSYWRYLAAGEDADVDDAQIHVAALGTMPDAATAVDRAAGEKIGAWLTQFGKAISDLPDARRLHYDRIRGEAKVPELSTVTAPRNTQDVVPVLEGEDPDAAITRVLKDHANRWPRHLVSSSEDNLFWFVPTTTWEKKVIATELAAGAAWWYRNPASGRQSVTVPWKDGDRDRGTHPDFIVWHDIDGDLRPSIVDPHGQNNADSVAKLRGLLKYAADHEGVYRAINPVIVIGDVYWTLPLQLATVRAQVKSALDSGKTIEQVFEKHGVVYGKA